MDMVWLQKKLEEIPDPQQPWGTCGIKLEDILVIGLATLLDTGSDFEARERFGKEREAALRKFLALPSRIPDACTFFRVFQRIKPASLSACLYVWVAEAREPYQWHINIDGKTICGSGKGEKEGTVLYCEQDGKGSAKAL